MLQKQKLGVIPVWDWKEVSCNVLVQWELLSGILHPFPAMQITAGGLHYLNECMNESKCENTACTGCALCKGSRSRKVKIREVGSSQVKQQGKLKELKLNLCSSLLAC